jgi:hypothetical protein
MRVLVHKYGEKDPRGQECFFFLTPTKFDVGLPRRTIVMHPLFLSLESAVAACCLLYPPAHMLGTPHFPPASPTFFTFLLSQHILQHSDYIRTHCLTLRLLEWIHLWKEIEKERGTSTTFKMHWTQKMWLHSSGIVFPAYSGTMTTIFCCQFSPSTALHISKPWWQSSSYCRVFWETHTHAADTAGQSRIWSFRCGSSNLCTLQAQTIHLLWQQSRQLLLPCAKWACEWVFRQIVCVPTGCKKHPKPTPTQTIFLLYT